MKLNVYECDLCLKEHRNPKRLKITICYANDSVESDHEVWRDLCSLCAEKILSTLTGAKNKGEP